MRFAIALIVILNLFVCSSAWAVTAWVSPTGEAAWGACQGATPLSGTAACSAATSMTNAVAGDLVYFRAGTYTPPAPPGGDSGYIPGWNPTNSGTSGNYITFQAYTGEAVVVNTLTDEPAFGTYGKNWIKWDGFQNTGYPTDDGVQKVVAIVSSTNVIITNCQFTGSATTWTNNHSFIQVDASSSVTIYNNTFTTLGGTGINTAAIWLMGGDNNSIYNNTFTSVYQGVAFKFLSQDNVNIYNNFFSNIGLGAIRNGCTVGATCSNFNIYQNVQTGGTRFFEGYDPTGTISGFDVYNNTIYLTATSTLINLGNENTTTSNWWNNIFYATTGTTTFLRFQSTADPSYCDYNNFYTGGTASWSYAENPYGSIGDWRTATPFDDNSVTTDPGFLNAGGSFALVTDFKRASYTTNGRGGAYASVMGAYITGSETIGYTAGGDITAPTQTGAVISANGTTLTLTFSESVSQGAAYANSHWDIDCTASGANISMTLNSGNGSGTWVMTLASVVYQDDTCNLDFSGTANSVEDASGNDLAAIVSAAITNSSTQAAPTSLAVSSGGTMAGGTR